MAKVATWADLFPTRSASWCRMLVRGNFWVVDCQAGAHGGGEQEHRKEGYAPHQIVRGRAGILGGFAAVRGIEVKGARYLMRPVDWTRIPNMTLSKRIRRRRYRCKSIEEKPCDKGWHPELCTYESEFRKQHALYFYNLLAYPWEKGAWERFVDKLERKYFPDDHIDVLVPPKDPPTIKKPKKAESKNNKSSRNTRAKHQVVASEAKDPDFEESGDLETSETDTKQRMEADMPEPEPSSPSVTVENSAEDDWQPISDVSQHAESAWDEEASTHPVPDATAPKPLLIKRGMALPEDWDGPLGTIILVDKPTGWTSFTVCSKLRRLLRVLKVGHAGTLDPMATGLLVVCVGKATKFAERYQAMPKMYSGTMRLGEATPSYDSETLVSERLPWEHITDEDMQIAKEEFVGTIRQVPPLHSALKVEGERLYEKARRGEHFQIAPRLISIDELEVERDSQNRQDFHFKVVCSKGTYIRSLCYDLGRALNTCAHLVALRRERIGDMSVEEAWSFSELGQNFAHEFVGTPRPKTPTTFKAEKAEAWNLDDLVD